MGKYFGTDGFRGEANVDLTADHAFRVGRFLGWYFTRLRDRPARIVIGKDTRRSGYMLEYALAGGITASGADAYLLHVTTTPSVAYIARTEGFDCGVMISASHNPYYDNGIKLLNSAGEKMEDGVIGLVESYLEGAVSCFGECWQDLPLATRENIGRTVDHTAGRNRYLGYLISLGLYSFRGMKVGLDCANGAAWNLARTVFEALGAQTFVLNGSPDGCNINRKAGSTSIEVLCRFVVEQGLDVGFAYDGDADRCLCVDEKGNPVTGDQILFLCGTYMAQRGELLKGRVVTTVLSNPGLYQALEQAGLQWDITDVGDKNVYERMMATGCRLGGEQSGHIIFSKYATTGDGILTSLKVMEVMMARKQPLSRLCEGMTVYPQVQLSVPVRDKAAALADPRVQKARQEAERHLGSRGRLLLRPSGTEPVIRILAEAESEALCRRWAEQVAGALRAFDDMGRE
ncbi:MAG: phosphoglucosamine mutase [Oscillospiraceae bacterium]|nr:phosphoglucosamine mutase [Oscillospiraceae bacterium]